MSTATLNEFERNLRTLIRSRHGIAVTVNYAQVKALLAAVNLPHGNAFMQKLQANGWLAAVPNANPGGHARYGVDQVVKLMVELNGGAA